MLLEASSLAQTGNVIREQVNWFYPSYVVLLPPGINENTVRWSHCNQVRQRMGVFNLVQQPVSATLNYEQDKHS